VYVHSGAKIRRNGLAQGNEVELVQKQWAKSRGFGMLTEGIRAE
jgi:hypothetical protein